MSRQRPRALCGTCFAAEWADFLVYLLTREERAAWANREPARIGAALAGERRSVIR